MLRPTAFALFALAACRAAYGQRALRVAFVSDLSGTFAATHHQKGFVDFAVPYINSRGGIPIGGEIWTIEVVVYDTLSDPEGTLPGIFAAIGNGQDLYGRPVGEIHAVIAGTSVSNTPIKRFAEQLGIVNIHTSGGNPATWRAADRYAFGMHLPFPTYTRGPLRIAAIRGQKKVAILRSYAHSFARASSLAALEWAASAGLEVVGPSVEWCREHLNATGECRLVGVLGDERCVCGSQAEVDMMGYSYSIERSTTFYEMDETRIGSGLKQYTVDNETTDFVRSIIRDIRSQGEMPEVFVNFAYEHHNALNALLLEGYAPNLLLGWHDGTTANWAQDLDGVLTPEHGVGAVGFGQWHPAMKFSDPLFGSAAACTAEYARRFTGETLDYNVAGAAAAAVVLDLALSKYVPEDFGTMNLTEQRGALQAGLLRVDDETMWGVVRFGSNHQNSGRETAAWQISLPNGASEPEQLCVFPADAAQVEMEAFPSWEAKFGCPPGSRNTGLVCEPCVAGKYSSQTTPGLKETQCEMCPDGLGTMATSTGNSMCTPCPVGFHNDNKSGICEPCPPGTAQGVLGGCDLCDSGRFSHVPGLAVCNMCPERTIQPDKGQQFCLCDDKSFRNPNETSPYGSSLPCLSCDVVLVGSSSRLGAGRPEECRCPFGSYLAAAAGGLSCAPCPEGLVCEGDRLRPAQAAGYWAEIAWEGAREEGGWRVVDGVLRCREENECPPAPAGACSGGRMGRACAKCVEGNKADSDGSCTECVGGDIMLGVVLIFGAIVGPAIAGLRCEADPSRTSVSLITAATAGAQLLWTLQTLAVIQMLGIKFPRHFKNVLDVLRIFALDFRVFSMPCMLGHSTLGQFLFVLLCFPAIVALQAVFLIAIRLRSGVFVVPFPRVFNFDAGLLSVLYLSLTGFVLQPFLCRQNPDGTMTMSVDPSTTCFDSPTHDSLVSLAVIGLLIYPVAMFSLAMWATWTYSRWIVTEKGHAFLRGFLFLFGRYKQDHYWCGLVHMARNLAVAIIPIAFSKALWLQATAFALVLISVGIFTAHGHLSASTSRLEAGLTVGIVIVLVASGPLMEIDEQAKESTLAVLLIGATTTMLGLALTVVALSIARFMKPSQMFSAFLCHHKAGAGSFARFVKIVLQSHMRLQVFLDSDDLRDVEDLFNIVRTSTRTLVVLLTSEVLKRPWCVGEIVTAKRNQVQILPVVCDSFCFANFSRVECKHRSTWNAREWKLLKRYRIIKEHIIDAITDLEFLPKVEMDRAADTTVQIEGILEIGRRCSSTMVAQSSHTTLSTATNSQSHRRFSTVIMGNTGEVEPLAVCHILQTLLMRASLKFASVIRVPEDIESLNAPITSAVFVLTAGVLTSSTFCMNVVQLLASVCHEEGLDALTHCGLTTGLAQADPAFEFPSASTLRRVEFEDPGLSKLGRGPRKTLAIFFKRLFRCIALPISPHGSEALLMTQVEGLHHRLSQLSSLGFEPSGEEDEDEDSVAAARQQSRTWSSIGGSVVGMMTVDKAPTWKSFSERRASFDSVRQAADPLGAAAIGRLSEIPDDSLRAVEEEVGRVQTQLWPHHVIHEHTGDDEVPPLKGATEAQPAWFGGKVGL